MGFRSSREHLLLLWILHQVLTIGETLQQALLGLGKLAVSMFIFFSMLIFAVCGVYATPPSGEGSKNKESSPVPRACGEAKLNKGYDEKRALRCRCVPSTYQQRALNHTDTMNAGGFPKLKSWCNTLSAVRQESLYVYAEMQGPHRKTSLYDDCLKKCRRTRSLNCCPGPSDWELSPVEHQPSLTCSVLTLPLRRCRCWC